MQGLCKIIKEHKLPILIALISKILILFFIAGLSVYIIPNSKALNLDIWELWNVWDARHYVSIASLNYQKVSGDLAILIGFLPFLPLLIFIFKHIFQTSFLISGYIVSAVATILLSIMLYKLVLLDYPKKVAIFTVFMLFIFPTSFFLHIPYTESLFILLSVSAFYFVRRRNYWASFLCVGLATFTKIAGLALIPAIVAEILVFDRGYFRRIDLKNKFAIIIFGLVLSLSGFLIYLFINYYIWGDPFYFNIIKKQFHSISFAPFGQGLVGAFSALSYRVGFEKFMLGYAQIAAFALGLIMSIYTLFKIRLSYGIFMIIVLWLSYSSSFWSGMPRHILPLFPMFIILALLSQQIIFRYLWILLSTGLSVLFAINFIQWGPVL